MRQKLIPKEVGESFGETGNDAEEVGFEGTDGALGSIAAMDVGGNELVGAVPVFGDDSAIFCTGLIVEDLVFGDVAALLELGYDSDVGGDTVAVVFGLKGSNRDDVGLAVVCKHDVLVAAARTDGDAAHVISKELADGLDPNVAIVGLAGNVV